MAHDSAEKLWRYSRIARIWALCLIGVAAALLALTIIVQAAGEEGLGATWLVAALVVAGITGIILFPLLRVFLRRGSLPSLRLPDAVKASGARRLEASPRDWRRWTLTTIVILFLSSAIMLMFLVAVLGGGGIVEGVVTGVLVAWGAATLDDVARIDRAERAEGRRYYAACRRPVGVGNHLVWLRAER
jgi:hypothetical protein